MLREIIKADYRAHEALVRPARAKPQVWRLVLGLFLVFWVIWSGMGLLWNGLYAALNDDAYRLLYEDVDTIMLPQSMLLVLYSFALFLVGTGCAVVVLHRRNPLTLIGAPHVALRQGVRVGLVLLVLMAAILVLPPYGGGLDVTQSMPVGVWLTFLGPALLGVLIQTSAEEVLFRGYIQQQLAARFANPAVWMLLPSILFALAHYAPETYGSNAWLVVIWAGAFGLITADLTARSGTLGPAIALHFVTNLSAMLLIAPQGEMSGLSLFQLGFSAADEAQMRSLLPVDFMTMLTCWLAARITLRR